MINTENIMKVVSLPPPLETPIDVTHNTIKLPILGRVQFVDDPQGRLYVSGVLAYWIYGTICTYYIVLVPAYNDELIPSFVIYGFLAASILCLLSLARASLTNPGHIPVGSYADETWNLCRTCNRMRPARAHHCRRCGQCVMRMDHHCPWINNCVGEGNHFAFVQLLFYAFLLSFFALILNLLHFWVFPKCVNCDKEAFHIKHSIWLMYVQFILALNMSMVMFGMFSQQHLNLILNRTTLETMSETNKNERNQVGRQCYKAYRDLCGQGHPIFWFWPLGKRRPALISQLQQTV